MSYRIKTKNKIIFDERKKALKTLKVKITFVEEVLGTASGNPEIHKEFIASKAPDAMSVDDEVATLGVDAVVEKSMTIVPKLEDGTPFFWDYQWKGFAKESCGMLRRVSDTKSAKLKAFKKEIDGLVFVQPRKIPIILPDGETIGNKERPLRAETAQGARVALANSESIPSGSTCELTWICYVDSDIELVKEWLDYGLAHGTGQWRNAGYGRFTYEILEESDSKKIA